METEPNAITCTLQSTKVDEEIEEEKLFHSKLQVQGKSLHFIVDNGSQKDLISSSVVKELGFPITPHPKPYSIGSLHKGRKLKVIQQCFHSCAFQVRSVM